MALLSLFLTRNTLYICLDKLFLQYLDFFNTLYLVFVDLSQDTEMPLISRIYRLLELKAKEWRVVPAKNYLRLSHHITRLKGSKKSHMSVFQ